MAEERVFKKVDFTLRPLSEVEYEGSIFTGCTFISAVLSGKRFSDCLFDGCDLTLAVMANTVWNNARFVNCKLLGLNFNACSQLLFSVEFEGCMMKLSAFHKMKLRKTRFMNRLLHHPCI